MKTKTKNLMGMSILFCAIGIIIMKYITGAVLDDYIMPLILILLSAVIFTNKKKEINPKKTEWISRNRMVLISVLFITFISGVATYIVYMF